MRKQLFPFLLAAWLLAASLCAGCGASSTTVSTGCSTVKITVSNNSATAATEIRKRSFMADISGSVSDFLGAGCAFAAIPSEVTVISFTITAPGMAAITRDTPISGQSSVMESFSVPNGDNRRFLIEAKDARDRVLYQGERTLNLSGPPVSILIDMQLMNDFTPPVFQGLSTADAISQTEVDLAWNQATDNVTSSANMYYFVFMSEQTGGEDFSTPTFTTSPGATSFRVNGLYPSTTYYFVIRAVDERGNQDDNLVEFQATTWPTRAEATLRPDDALDPSSPFP